MTAVSVFCWARVPAVAFVGSQPANCSSDALASGYCFASNCRTADWRDDSFCVCCDEGGVKNPGRFRSFTQVASKPVVVPASTKRFITFCAHDVNGPCATPG